MGTARWVIGGAAAAAAVLRLPGALWPLLPDEAGFLLVARHAAPGPGSLYGPYFVDRPPPMIALVGAVDQLGGPYLIRALAALGCVVLVLTLAAAARRFSGERGAAVTAVVTAALVGTPLINSVSAQSEVLAMPWVGGSILLALRALESSRRRALLAAAGAGLLATCAVAMKQNIVTGLVVTGVLLLGAGVAGRVSRGRCVALLAAALAGAAVPVAATTGWAVAAGVRLETLWYATYGFRSDASRVIASQEGSASEGRADLVLLVAVATGLVPLLGWFLLRLPVVWRRAPVLTAATAAALLVEGAGVLLSGSFWPAYLFALAPGTGLAVAGLTGIERVRWRVRTGRGLVGFTATSALVAGVVAMVLITTGTVAPRHGWTGRAVAAAAEPGDTLVVFGGRPDLQYASGLRSPYPYLWSLPMRTLDPGLARLRRLLRGPQAPTWLVRAAPFDSWELSGHRRLVRLVRQRYARVGTVCGNAVFLRTGTTRTLGRPDCGAPWGLVP